MVYHKRYMVTLTVPKSFLSELPQFATPQTKSRQKRAAEKKATAAGGSKTASPAPDSKTKDGNGKVAKPKAPQKAKTWVKKPLQFKTFSGFKVKYITWRQKESRKEKAKIEKDGKTEKSDTKTEGKPEVKTEQNETPLKSDENAAQEPASSPALPKIEVTPTVNQVEATGNSIPSS